MKTFRQAVQSDAFTISAELTLKSSSTADDIARQAALLGPWVDGLLVNDNPWSWLQMSPVAAASLVLRQGLDPIAVLSCRDRNRIALLSDLLGLRALGVSSLLLMHGNDIAPGHPVKADTVFDTKGRKLVTLAGEVGQGDPPAPEREFFIGINARAFRPAPDWDAAALIERSDAGARFLQTQLCFNIDILRQYMKFMVEKRITWKYSVIVSLAALPSAQTAHWLKKHVTGARIPKEVINRLEGAADPEREGVAICAELMREIAEIPGISGVNLLTMGNEQAICDAIRASGLR